MTLAPIWFQSEILGRSRVLVEASLDLKRSMTYAVGGGTLSLRTRGAPEGFSIIEADAAEMNIAALGWTGSAFEPFLSWSLPQRQL